VCWDIASQFALFPKASVHTEGIFICWNPARVWNAPPRAKRRRTFPWSVRILRWCRVAILVEYVLQYILRHFQHFKPDVNSTTNYTANGILFFKDVFNLVLGVTLYPGQSDNIILQYVLRHFQDFNMSFAIRSQDYIVSHKLYSKWHPVFHE
jgi:hypothetical protein